MRPKRFDYEIALTDDGTLAKPGDAPRLGPTTGWLPEDLVLGGLAMCTLKSLRFHAARRDLSLSSAEAAARGHVTRPEGEERFRLVEAIVEVDVRLDETPATELLGPLLERVEHDCFVGASLVVDPDYRWTVNGDLVRTSARA